MLLLDTGFPVPVVPATSGFPRSPLALLTVGRTDFFMLSPLMLVHLQLGLDVEEGRKKVKNVKAHSESSNFPQRKKNHFRQQKRKKERNHFHHSEHQKTLVSSCRSINRRSNSKIAAAPTAEW